FIPIIVLGLPVFDTTLVFVSRLRRGLNPLTHPGTDHLSHRLVARGFTRREAVLTLYLVSGALGVIAMFCAQMGNIENYFAAALVAVAGLIALWRFEFAQGSGELA
ncbi:MAG: undecaprenyl/decaprenyl-phosphate alpha-N-acetylglucosaminyl 1-phosphate transferase, partial [Chloroflexota bacterium]|nr:undecaprenyl/decaprenyl-phosphate alpha-N-acetylglucosaminyl 1-phosphate transferase [Chloroflexota bacterium]